MQRIAATLILLALAPALLAGCFQPTPGFVASWENEAAAHGPMGVKANLSIAADDHVTVGDGRVIGASAPFAVLPHQHSSRAAPYLFFHGTVLDVGTGLIVLEGERIEITGGLLSKLPVDRVAAEGDEVSARLRPGEMPEKPEVRFDESLHAMQSAYFFADSTAITATDLVVESADTAQIVMAGNATDLTLPIRFDAEHVALDHGSTFRLDEVVASFDSFGYAGTTRSGGLELEGRPDIDTPTAVFGRDATLHFTPSQVTATGPFRLTQAATADGYALEATVELQAVRDQVQVKPGNSTWAQVRYRESGYLGAAIIENVTVTGSAAALVRVPLEAPPWIVETLWQEMGDAGLPGLFMAPWLLIASPFLIIGEALFKAFDCLLNDCPGEHPYPAWMEPGEIGRFYYQVDATDAAPGTYEGTIVFRGANHETVTLPVRIDVRA